jgi:hypothetical protein
VRLSALAAMLAGAALVSAPASAACLTQDDARTLLAVALPDAIEGLAARCGPVLPTGAFLPTEGKRLADRYRREAPADPARARHAIQAASGQDLSFLADDDTVTRLAHDYVEKAIRGRVSTNDCPTVDSLVALAAPLRADAMAEAILLALQVAGPEATPGFALCGPNEGERR